MPVKLPKAERAGLGRVGTAGRAMADDVKRCAILQDQQRKGTIAGPTKARMRFGGIKIVRRIRKPWEGKRPAGGRRGYKRGDRKGERGRISVGLVRWRETPRRLEDQKRKTDIWGISKAVVGRAVLSDFDIGRSK
ncbi:hypothetical protein BY996DRAFT_6439625 [Phakopsora pachyrhizi]|nr:hypothetical protein BY996DRAFT_6439625 [Phakopsora pachyrhizi]